MSRIYKHSTQKIRDYFLLHLLILFSTIGGICSKTAAQSELFSFRFFFFYGAMLFVLIVYAIGWQQIIKKLPLLTAYCNKAITVVWGMLWGALLFGETITLKNIIGAGIVMVGVVYVVMADE